MIWNDLDKYEERIGGETFRLAPGSTNHAITAGNIYYIFGEYLKEKDDNAFCFGLTVYLTDDDWFIPDVTVVCDRSKIREDGIHGAPDLVVEVLFSVTAKNDRGYKMNLYARHGVREYWLVDPENRTVEQYFLCDGRFCLGNLYALHRDWALETMTERQRGMVQTHFKCSLFDDLDIALEDIFDLEF